MLLSKRKSGSAISAVFEKSDMYQLEQQPQISADWKDLEKFLWKDREIKCILLKHKHFSRSLTNLNKILDMTKLHFDSFGYFFFNLYFPIR